MTTRRSRLGAIAGQAGGTRTRLASAIAALALLLSACADDSAGPDAEDRSEDSGSAPSPTTATTDLPSPEPSTVPSTAPPDPTEPGAVIAGGTSDFGTILFDDTGQAIYMFDVEATSDPRCYDSCAKAWPPVLTAGEPVAGEGVDATLLGTTKRDNGTTQVTYNGHPLYFYAHEDKHEVKCHDVFLNGGSWYAVHPDGGPAS